LQPKPLVVAELNPPLNVILVKDSADLRLVDDFIKGCSTFGFDTETNVVDDFTERVVRTVQIGNKEQQFVIDLLHFAGSTEDLRRQGWFTPPSWSIEVVRTLRSGFESGSHLKVGVNTQFDYEVLKFGLGLRTWNLYDCKMVEMLIHCGKVSLFAPDFWGMKDMLLRYAGLQMSKELQQSFDLSSELTQEQIEYAGLDTRLPLAIMGAQSPVVKRDRLERVARIENQAIPAFGDMHLNGFYLDKEEWLENVEKNRIQHLHNLEVLDKYMIPVVGDRSCPNIDLAPLEYAWKNEDDKVIRAQNRQAYQAARKQLSTWEKQSVKWEGQAAINYGSPAQILAALRKMGFGEKALPNTNDNVLKTLAQESQKTPVEQCKNPVIRALQNFRETEKISDSYGASYPDDYINANTGRVHSKINQIGADTGRTSASSPNVQNIMKGSNWRRCFKPRPGYVMLTIDMSGAELRIMAELSGEQTWIDAFSKNWDVHSVGAEMMYQDRWRAGADEGCPYVAAHQKCDCKAGHKTLRNNSKALNFKIAYGGADLSESLNITKKESDEILRLWRKANPTLDKYLNDSGRSAAMNCESRTFSDRRRLFNKPTWEKAKELAIERLLEDKKDPLTVNSDLISRAYKSLFARIERQGKNTPIQGGNIDIAKEAIGTGVDKNGAEYFWHRLETEFKSYLVSFVHDEFVIEAPADKAQEVMDMVKDCVRRAGAEFMSSVTMECEGAIAECWTK
jgi:DNA polymerase-1